MNNFKTEENIKQVILKTFRYNISNTIDYKFINKPEVDVYCDTVYRQLIVTLTQDILGEQLVDFKLKVHANWWEHFKERWFNKWLKRKFPIKYHHYSYDAKALYPQISLPDYKHHIKIERNINYDRI